MQWVIIAGVLLYALTLYTLITVCHAAGSFERFYDGLMRLEPPQNEEAPRVSAGGPGETDMETTGTWRAPRQ